MKIKCIAIDDEPPALMQMEDYISKIPFLELVKTFDNGLESLEFIKKNEIDLIFLDIQMEGFSGLQLLNVMKKKPRIILTTAYDRYAIQAFDLDVSDYLLKPISFERFLKAVEKVYDQISSSQKTAVPPVVVAEPAQEGKNYIFVKTEYRMQRVDFKDILYVEGLKEYLIIQTATGRVITLQNFKTMEEMLPSSNFVRVHKSYMVAMDKIEFVERNRIKISDKLIPIGDTYRKIFFELLDKKGI
ncbi:MAG TPA: LytTR family DNA-binding domain-containing protein [Bacteroidales bacterium]|nr:LytTR family DNA-binding domain-containing protein [Bacteroidales bacterium]HPS17555.1 LytTR family DNA-binding domain-containing protein [Bacteroidales bacterium]